MVSRYPTKLSEVYGIAFRDIAEPGLNLILARLKTHVPREACPVLDQHFAARITTPVHLYRPMCSVALGNTDNLAVFLSDEFSHAYAPLEDSRLPVRQSCVALCPDMGMLGDQADECGVFCDIDELFSTYASASPTMIPDFRFMTQRPLIAVTYYRTMGLCNLGSGMLFQEAIIREMRRGISEAFTKLSEGGTFISKERVSSLKCAFLIPIGWADLCTVMFAQDFSAIFSMLGHIRPMRFRHLYAIMEEAYGENNALQMMAREFDLHSRIAKWENSFRQDGAGRAGDLLSENHVWSCTATTLSIDHHAFLGDSVGRGYSGLVSADPHFNISPGHTQALIKNQQSKGKTKIASDVKGYEDAVWIAAGLYDSTARTIVQPEETSVQSLSDLISLVKELRGLGYDPGPERQMWGVQDLFTEVLVPVPRILLLEEQEGVALEHVSMHPLLAELKRHVFERQEGLLSIPQLRQSLEKMRIPLPLRAAMLQCFSDYAKALADPMLFDNVLDVYDVFAAVHRLFTQELLDDLNDRLKTGKCTESRRLSFLDEAQMQEIAAVVELIEDTLSRRTEMAFRQARHWQDAIDSRGGFSRFISATDVPIKCGLGMLRRVLAGKVSEVVVPPTTREDVDSLQFRSRVGGACRINYSARAYTHRFGFGLRDNDTNFIAGVSFNTAHLTRPTFMYTHIHESGHLLCDFIRGRRDTKSSPSEAYCREYCWSDDCARIYPKPTDSIKESTDRLRKHLRFEEVFAEMLAFGLIFGDDPEKYASVYLRQYLAMYLLDPISTHPDPPMALERFTESLIRAFMAVDPYVAPSQDGRDLYEPEIGKPFDVSAARARFMTFVESGGWVFLDYDRFWLNEEGRSYILGELCSAYDKDQSFPVLCCIWRQVRAVLNAICSVTSMKGSVGTSPPKKDSKWILSEFETGYRTGRPILRFLYNREHKQKPLVRLSVRERHWHLDSMYILRHLLRMHAEEIFAKLDQERECCNQPDRVSDRGTNMQMLDRQLNGIACMDFAERGKYLQHRLSLLMTLWDLSSTMRGRSLGRLLDEVLPKEQTV